LQPGESKPAGMARSLGLTMTQFRDFLRGSIASGYYSGRDPNPTEAELRNHFRGLAMTVIELDRELGSKRLETDRVLERAGDAAS
jgi:hypothetical protein